MLQIPSRHQRRSAPRAALLRACWAAVSPAPHLTLRGATAPVKSGCRAGRVRLIGPLGALLVVVAALSASANALSPGVPVEETLANGLRLIACPASEWPLVSLAVVVRAGSAEERECPPGTARLVAKLLMERAGPGPSLEQRLAAEGGIVQGAVQKDSFILTYTGYRETLSRAAPVLAAGLLQARFDTEQVEAAAAELRQMAVASPSDGYQALGERLAKALYGAHPYSREPSGEAAGFDAITVEDARRFYDRCYRPDRMALITVGDLDLGGLRSLVADSFGAAAPSPLGASLAPPEPPVPPRSPVIVREVADWPSPLVGIAWLGPDVRAAAPGRPRDICAMDLIYTLLGAGPRSLLARALAPTEASTGEEDRGPIAAGWRVEFVTRRHSALFEVTAVAMPDQELLVRAAILGTIGRLREAPVSEAELAEAKRLLRAEYLLQNATYDQQVDALSFYEAIDSYAFATEYLDQVNAVTAEDIQRAACAYLAPERYAAVIAAPAQAGPTVEAMLR